MAKDIYHQHVKEALVKAGWTITHDPYYLKTGELKLPIDLAAERIIAAEKGSEWIAVEVKSFVQLSVINEFHTAVGQYINYRSGLRKTEPERILYLAIPEMIYERLRVMGLPEAVLEENNIFVLIFDPTSNQITQWIK